MGFHLPVIVFHVFKHSNHYLQNQINALALYLYASKVFKAVFFCIVFDDTLENCQAAAVCSGSFNAGCTDTCQEYRWVTYWKKEQHFKSQNVASLLRFGACKLHWWWLREMWKGWLVLTNQRKLSPSSQSFRSLMEHVWRNRHILTSGVNVVECWL